MSNKGTRDNILDVSLKLFAEKGFYNTSTRQIAEKAKVNLSAIKYHFGDKAGLYRAAYLEPMCPTKEKINLFHNQKDLEKSLLGVFEGMFDLLKGDEKIQLCLKLHMREMIEPTEFWDENFNNEVLPYYKALLYVIKKEIPEIKDDDAHRLIFSIKGLVFYIFSNMPVIEKISPNIIKDVQALDVWKRKIISYAKVIIDTEKGLYEKKI
jgi:TetR/AcrR family transcriptional regulator, regulator of cefoperazone and chloramphenicol sensitivity